MKTILFVTSSISYGGASKILCFVCNSLCDRGYTVHIANLKTTGKNDTYNQSINDKITIHDISSSVADNTFYGRRVSRIDNIIKLRKVTRKIKPDVMVGFTVLPNFMISIVGKFERIPTIMSERGDPYKTFSNSLSDRIRKIIIEKCSGGVFQTEGAKLFYNQTLQRNSTVIPNPIFIQKIPKSYRSKEKTIVSLGRLDNYQKRYDVMISAFKEFSSSHPDYTLLIFGQGPDSEKIQQWCVDEGIERRVKFCGLTTDSLSVLAESPIFLITSDFEGISNSLLEAMAVGLACVSTDHSPGGARLLIQDHVNGILAPCGDASAIANALSEFADNDSLMKSCGREAKKVIERFAPDKIVDMWEDYIDLILSKKRI